MNMKDSFSNIYGSNSYTSAIKTSSAGYVPISNLLERAIVIDIKRDADLNSITSQFMPQFSIKARISGSNSGSGNITDINYSSIDKWYIPLLSMHNIVIPELGEEIFIIRETNKKNSNGYWISRVNENNLLNSYLKNEDYRLDNIVRTGTNLNIFDINNLATNIQPSKKIKKFSIPFLYGDVIQQGRSDTYIRHSFNPKNKNGVLEMGIKDDIIYNYEILEEYASIGRTSTKTIHLKNSFITDIMNIKKATSKIKTNVGPFPDGSFQIVERPIVESRKNLIINIADETHNISVAEGSGRQLYRHALGERLTKFQDNFINIVVEVIDYINLMNENMQQFMEAFLQHTHVLPEINIQIPDKEVSFYDEVRKPDKVILRPPKNVRIRTGVDEDNRPIYANFSVERPPLRQPGGIKRTLRKKKIEYDKITIGGEEEPRITTTTETNTIIDGFQENVEKSIADFKKSSDNLTILSNKLDSMLSKFHYLN